jgi:hypothetical protein
MTSAPSRPAADQVALRPVPYPYRAMLAICSDLDETPDREVYWDIVRFLNSPDVTTMGPGVDLEVGNSIYFEMAPAQFAYWNTDDAGRAMVRALIRSGHVDCFHSYGDLATTRAHAGRALDELQRHECAIDVWIDHAVAPSNFGADIMRGRGDLPGDAVYHADLTCGFGVRYVWRGRVTSVIGQEVPRSLRGILDHGHRVSSARTVAKEWVKGWLARFGSRKYAMHGPNLALRRTRLRDGRAVWEFLRANPYWGGVENAATAAGLAEVLRRPFLDALVQRGGVATLYTHLGKVRDPRQPLPPATREALRLLASYRDSGQVLVTTTKRLLDWCRRKREAVVEMRETDEAICVDLRLPQPADTFDGLSLYVPDDRPVRVFLDGREVAGARRNPPDHTGRVSLSVDWPRLRLPCL